MSLDLGLVARLLAWRRGRAVPVASSRRVHLSPAARVLCPLQLAGEDATLHAYAWGPVHGPPEHHFVADPRSREAQFALFDALGQTLDAWTRAAVAQGELPQLWLPSAAALTLLDVLAERLRGRREGEPGAILQQRLFSLLRQSHLEGCQSVVVATEAITAHWATGQQPGEDGHLGSLLIWLDPPVDRSLQDAIAAAERVPMSVKTRPELDQQVLGPALGAWARAHRAGDAARAAAEEARIGAALRETLTPIFAATQQVYAALQHGRLQDMPGLAELVQRDRGAFEREFNPPEPEEGKPRAHPIGRAAIDLVVAEDALEQHAATLVHGDAVALAAARARGDAVRARVREVQRTTGGRSGRALHVQVFVEIAQPISRLRAGDAVQLRGLPQFSFRVLGVEGAADRAIARLELKDGKRRAAELEAGCWVDLVPPAPNLGAVGGRVKQMNLRLAERPWTHADQLPAGRTDAAAPEDPLADVEALRTEEAP